MEALNKMNSMETNAKEMTREEKLAFFRANAILTRSDILAACKAIREYFLSDRVQQDLPLEQLMTLLAGQVL